MGPVGANGLGLEEAAGAARGALLQPRHCGPWSSASLPGLRLLLVKDVSIHGLCSEVPFRNLSSFGFFSSLVFSVSQRRPLRSGTAGVYQPDCLLMALGSVVGGWVMQLVLRAEESCCLGFFLNVAV